MSSITFSIVHLYLLKEMSTYLVIIQIEQVHFLFSIYSLQQQKTTKHLQLLLRGSVFRVNIYYILRQEPLQKTLCESVLFIFSPYCTRCSLMKIKLSCLVYLVQTTSTHFIYGFKASDIWSKTTHKQNEYKCIYFILCQVGLYVFLKYSPGMRNVFRNLERQFIKCSSIVIIVITVIIIIIIIIITNNNNNIVCI